MHEHDQGDEGELLDMLGKARVWVRHLVQVGVAHGDGITMPWRAREMGEGGSGAEGVQGVQVTKDDQR